MFGARDCHAERLNMMLSIAPHLALERIGFFLAAIVGFLTTVLLWPRDTLFSSVNQHTPLGELLKRQLGITGNSGRLLKNFPYNRTGQTLLDQRQQTT